MSGISKPFAFEEWAITPEELQEERTRYLIDAFLVEQAITMFYGQEKQGKSWLMYALTHYLCEHERVSKVIYVDQDNPKRQLKERGIDRLIERYEKLRYLIRGSTPLSGMELVDALCEGAVGQMYSGMVFVFDSTRDFVGNTDSDIQAKRFMESMKRMRDAGASVILVHHATKSGRSIDGSSEFTKSADNVYEVLQREREGHMLYFDLPIYRDRDAIEEVAVSVDTQYLSLEFQKSEFVGIKKENEEFIEQVCEALASHKEGLNQSALLEALGYRRDDKTRRALLAKYVGTFWKEETVQNKKIYRSLKGIR